MLLLVLAAVLFAMAVYLLVTKGPPRTILTLVLVAVAIAIGSVAVPDDHDVHISIVAPMDEATVPAGEIVVRVALSGGRLTASSDDDVLDSGHLHVLLDGKVVSMPNALTTQVTLPPGRHVIEAELVSASHRSLSPRVLARAEITAAGT